MSLLTIVTITKDDHLGLIDTVNSLKGFYEFNIQHIIIDGSNSEIQVENKKVELNNKISYYYRDPQGISDAFNFGISKATGKWIWFLNSGDIFSSLLSEGAILNMLQFSNSSIVVFQIKYKQQGVVSLPPPNWLLWPNITSWIPHPSTFILKKHLDDINGFDTEYKIAMDYDFWYKISLKNYVQDVISIPIVLFDEQGVSSVLKNDTLKEVRRIKRKYFFSTILIGIKKILLYCKSY